MFPSKDYGINRSYLTFYSVSFWAEIFEERKARQIIDNLKSCIMKATVRKSLEIPAKKHPKQSVVKKAPDATVDKTYSLVVNLWIFRYEYYREQTDTVTSEQWTEKDPWKRVFFLSFREAPDVGEPPKCPFHIFRGQMMPFAHGTHFCTWGNVGIFKVLHGGTVCTASQLDLTFPKSVLHRV